MIPTFIDTHGHVQFNAFSHDYKEVIERTRANGGWIVMPGTQIDTSRRAVEIAEEYADGLYAAIGLHPVHLESTRLDPNELGGGQGEIKTRTEEFDRVQYEALLARGVPGTPRVVAVGEIGLDYWRRPKTTARREAYIQKQKNAFIAQLDFAADHGLPVILHCRVAFDDMYKIVREHPIAKRTVPGVVHSFTGEKKDLDNFLGLGFMIAYNGLIFKLKHLPAMVQATPLDHVVLETDAPYLTPPELGEVRNEPNNARITARYIAKLKDIDEKEVLEQTTQNARILFNI